MDALRSRKATMRRCLAHCIASHRQRTWGWRCHSRPVSMQASSFSRGIGPPRFAVFPHQTWGKRSAERRSGAAAPVGGPMT